MVLRQALRMTCFTVPLCETHDLITYMHSTCGNDYAIIGVMP